MADVVTMPGVLRLTEDHFVAPERCLQSALGAGLRDVVIVGRSISGRVECWSSSPDADTAVGLMHRGISWLSCSEMVAADEPGSG